MITDFLRECNCILNSEKEDFNDIIEYFQGEQAATMMPITMLSFWAIYALERKPGEDFSMNGYFKNTLSGTYIIPLMNDHVSLKVEKLINKFYNDEDLRESSLLYGIDFD